MLGNNPVILIGEDEPVAIINPGELVTLYPVAPDEAVNDTSAELLEENVAEISVGALGTVIIGIGSLGNVIIADDADDDDDDVPAISVDITLNV